MARIGREPIEDHRARSAVEHTAQVIHAAIALAVPFALYAQGHERTHDIGRSGQEEDEPPAQILRDEATQDRPERQADIGGCRGIADHASALLRRMRGHEHCHARTEDCCQCKALQQTEKHQGRHRLHEPGQKGHECDRYRADGIEVPPPHDVREPAERHQQGHGTQQIGRDNPAELLRRHRKFRRHRRNRNIDGAAHERSHERRDEHRDKYLLFIGHSFIPYRQKSNPCGLLFADSMRIRR